MASQISLSGGRLTGPGKILNPSLIRMLISILAKLKAVKGLLDSLEKDLVNQSLKADGTLLAISAAQATNQH
jgi:hypothetical protein